MVHELLRNFPGELSTLKELSMSRQEISFSQRLKLMCKSLNSKRDREDFTGGSKKEIEAMNYSCEAKQSTKGQN